MRIGLNIVSHQDRLLLTEVRACVLCAEHLPLGPRPVVQVHPLARILIAGQAPGRKVHETGVPFDLGAELPLVAVSRP